MAQLVVRNLPDEVKERLRRRAKQNGHSLEAEARQILERSVVRDSPVKPSSKGAGAKLAERMKAIGVTREDTSDLERNIAELRKSWRARNVLSSE